MFFSIGQVAKMFGVSVESILYYEKEHLISPQKNPQNGYRQFSSEDIFLLSDILFYRSVDIPLKQIEYILKGLDLNGISTLISAKTEEINNKILKYEQLLLKIKNWDTLHNKDGINKMGSFDIREMPIALKPQGDFTDSENSIVRLINEIHINEETAYYLTFAFSCDFKKINAETKLNKYVVLDSSVDENLPFPFENNDLEEEYCAQCLYTVVKFSSEIHDMFQPIIDYAKINGIKLSGKIYGRLCIVNYESGQYTEYYRIYAEIRADEPIKNNK